MKQRREGALMMLGIV
jgi:hypothetical protein